MNMTTALVEHALEKYGAVSYIDPDSHKKYSLPLLADGGYAGDDFLYVMPLSCATEMLRDHPDCHIVCTPDAALPKSNRHGLILTDGSASLEEILCSLQKSFAQLGKWVDRLKNCVLTGGDYQQLLNIAEDMIDADMVMVDSAFTIVASSSAAQDAGDPIMQQVLSRGFYPEELLSTFRKGGLFSSYERTKDILINDLGTYTEYATAGYWCRNRETPMLGIVMVCRSSVMPPYLKALFRILVDMTELCFRMKLRVGAVGAQTYEPLLHELLNGSSMPTDVIGERARSVGLSFSGFFKLYQLSAVESDNFMVERTFRSVSAAFPQAKVIVHSNDILMLCSFASENSANANETVSTLGPILQQYNMYCGVSRQFFNLAELSAAYSQSSCAIFYGRWLHQMSSTRNRINIVDNLLSCPTEPNVFYYENVALYQMVEYGVKEKTEIFRFSPYIRALERLLEHDREKGSFYYRMLFIYLSLERRPTDTAAALNMHRTRLLYHLDKIQEIIGLTLNDANIRLNFILAYRAMELME